MDTEKVRLSFKPEKIKLLFIAESPPASGDFFYVRSRMTVYTARAFGSVFEESFISTSDFLNFFQDKGCYLEDLTSTAVNKMASSDREKYLKKGILQLSDKLRLYNPEAIVIMLKKIERHVKSAVAIAGLTCPVYALPFPGNGHQNKFIRGLKNVLDGHYFGENIT